MLQTNTIKIISITFVCLFATHTHGMRTYNEELCTVNISYNNEEQETFDLLYFDRQPPSETVYTKLENFITPSMLNSEGLELIKANKHTTTPNSLERMIEMVSKSITTLGNMIFANMHPINMKDIPPMVQMIKMFSNLKTLTISDITLSPEIVKEIFTKLTAEKLTTLSLFNNELDELPSEIEKFTNLKKLFLRFNKLTQLPVESLVKLPQLRSIDISYNNFSDTEIKKIKAKLPKLSYLTNETLFNKVSFTIVTIK